MADLRAAGRAGRLGARLTAVVVDGQQGKEYRTPTAEEVALDALYAEIPFGRPDEPTPSEESLGMRVPRYGFDTWRSLFTDRQLLAISAFVREIRRTVESLRGPASPAAAARGVANRHDAGVRDAGPRGRAPSAGGDADVWREALAACLTCAVSKTADYGSVICSWNNGRQLIRNTFARFALPMVWDYCEVNPLSETTGGFRAAVEWVPASSSTSRPPRRGCPLRPWRGGRRRRRPAAPST